MVVDAVVADEPVCGDDVLSGTGSAPTLWTGTEERRSANPSTAIIKTGAIWTGDEEPEATGLTTGHGSATRMDFEGEGRYRLTDATYSTCTPVAV